MTPAEAMRFAMQVACPACGAGQQEVCVTPSGARAQIPHFPRREQAAKAAQAGAR